MDECRKNIQQFLDRNLGQWTGLVAGCQDSSLQSWLAFNPGEGRTHLGTEPVTYRFRSLSNQNFGDGVFFYFDQDLLGLITTDYWSFDLQECVELVRQLGQPVHRLDLFWRNQTIEGGEFVYNDKGISLAIFPETQLIASVTVYPACSLDTYKAKYYKSTPAREFNPDD